MRSTARRWLPVAALAAFAGCGGNEYAEPPPAPVTVRPPEVRDITRWAEYTGNTRAVERVDVRARVKGFLDSQHFEAGDIVQQGELLFVIDPEPFQVALDAAEAELASARAELQLARTQLQREEQALETRAVSEVQVIQTRAKRDKAAAAVKAAEAAVANVELDLSYAHVKAPITGRVGRRLVDMGNLVGAGESTLLTQMVRYDPIHVYFNISERDLLQLQREARERRAASGKTYQEESAQEFPVFMGLANEPGFPHQGRIDYTDLQVNPETGTFLVRGLFENPAALDGAILPGLFVRVRFPVGQTAGALLVTERALSSDQSGRYLLVVNSENAVEQRTVEVGPLIDGKRVIESGIRPEDRVIVNGLQRARPGAVVAPQGAEGAPPPSEEAATPDADA